jgi:diaminopimelate decarboxylase
MNHIQQLIEKYDSSFFFYDLDAFEAHIQNIKKTLHPEIKVFYACKANPLSKILSLFNANGFGVDVASMGELHQAKTAGVQNLIATGPAKSLHYMGRLLSAGVSTIVCESPHQLADLNRVADERRLKQDVLLRVQLDWDGEKSILGGSAITPFGIGAEDWKKVNLLEYANLNIKGLHCFQWGNILDGIRLQKIWDATISKCVTLAQELNVTLDVLDLGGGLGVSYSDDRELPFSQVHELLLGLKSKYELKEIWLELGRYSIANFGSYFTKIIDIKTVRGKNLIITDGGINHIARPTLVNEAFPCTALNHASLNLQSYNIHGPLCTALDFLGEQQLPKELKVGDWLQFKKTGAYGFTESMPYFLCHQLAGEAISYKGTVEMIRVPKLPDWMV